MMVSHLERFEAIARVFYADTGVIAPGKDSPLNDLSPAERRDVWAHWIKTGRNNLAVLDYIVRLERRIEILEENQP